MSVDLNADLGESYGVVTSGNVACGAPRVRGAQHLAVRGGIAVAGRGPGPAAPAAQGAGRDARPRRDWFTARAWADLRYVSWTVTADGNRVGVRLAGGPLERTISGELPSEGLVRGAVQVPASSDPLIFLADHPETTSGSHHGRDHSDDPHGTPGGGSRESPALGMNRVITVRIAKVLVANRGEIAVRVIRAAADAGLPSVAVYAEPDADALFVALADEAYALGGTTPAETYLDIGKLLDVAARSGANAVHPGYGFLAENAAFAAAVLAAGLIWIGPPPAAIDALGDKVKARHIAQTVGAPLVPGTPDPVADAAAVVAFADEHGLPVAIKAAYGGGGRGLKVARTREEIPALFESATREAVTAFGRGECFVERYLDRPRHVETQCLADTHGNVVVVSTRDCSLQRRHQKLVEEAPAPFLIAEQVEQLYAASKAILTEAGYVGAGTCEFLVAPDGTISFLEVNTRLQVEHPVSEQVTGLDLVREMFRIAEGEPLGYPDPAVAGHSIEFRINAEDAGRNFMPAPGTLTAWQPPAGPGVRVDEGYRAGMTVPGSFDSLVAKIVVTGADRPQALARARRALRELVVEGMPTVLPFHRAVLDDPAFVAADGHFGVHTRWIETEFANEIPPYAGVAEAGPEPIAKTTLVVEVNGKRLEVVVPAGLGAANGTAAPARPTKPVRRSGGGAAKAPSGDALTSPMQGTIVKVAVVDGDAVQAGDLIVVLEAMKMEQPLNAHRAGTVERLTAQVGATVTSGSTLCLIVDG